MKITIEPTENFVTIDGVPHRRWFGQTDLGIPCDVFVDMVRVANDRDQETLDAELTKLPAPKWPPIDIRLLR